MSALSDLEKELGLPAFDILFFKETKIEALEGIEKYIPSRTSASNTGNKKNKIEHSESQHKFNDILSNSQIERIIKYIQ